jgi:hypothetical protein
VYKAKGPQPQQQQQQYEEEEEYKTKRMKGGERERERKEWERQKGKIKAICSAGFENLNFQVRVTPQKRILDRCKLDWMVFFISSVVMRYGAAEQC